MAGSCGGLPVFHADDGQAHLALLIDVGMVDLCLEGDLGGLEGVLRRKDDLDPKGSFVIRSAVLEANNSDYAGILIRELTTFSWLLAFFSHL